MSLLHDDAHLNTAKSSLGRVIAARTPAELKKRLMDAHQPRHSSEGVIVCCGTAYLTVERLLYHQQETNCQISNISPFSREEENPLDEVSGEEDQDQEPDDSNEFDPIIDSVESLQAEDIEDIDIFEEEPRALIESNQEDISRYIRDAYKNAAQSSFRHDNKRDPIGLSPEDEGQDDDEDDDEDDDVEHEGWQNIVNEDDDDDNNVMLTEWDEDELEEVEIYGEYERNDPDSMSGIQPNFNVEATYSERESRSRSTDMDNDRRVEFLRRQEQEGKWKCDFPGCTYSTVQEKNLNIHAKSAHDPNGKFSCPECVCQYSKGNQLTQHISMVHKNKQDDVERGNSTPTSASIATKILPKATNPSPKYLVTYSGKKTTGPHSHEQIGQFKTETGVFSFNKVFTNNKTMYTCRFCEYMTKKKATIITHSKSAHNTNAKFVCPYCSCGYAAAAPLHLHVARQHPDKPKLSIPKSKSEKTSHQVPKVVGKPAKDNPIVSPTKRPSTYGHQQKTEIVMPPSAPTAPTDSYRLVFSDNKMFFKCEACGFQARDLPLTSAHIHNTHGPSAKHFCKYCTFRFSSSATLGLHVANSHPEYCQDTVDSDEPGMEILAVEGVNVFRCKLCTYVVPDGKKLRQHILVSHDPNGTFACGLCTCRFFSVGLLNVHKSNCHPDMDEVGDDAAGLDSRDYEDIPAEKTPPRKKTNPKASATMKTSYSIQVVNNKRVFTCDGCGQNSPKEKEIKRHITAAHHPKNKFKCPQCLCRYAFSAGLMKHISSKHKADATMPILSPAGISKDRHQVYKPVADGFSSIINNGVRSFKCNKCKFSTSEECMIASHKGLHLMSNKYPCHVCSYRFSTSTLLLQHQTADHDRENSSNASSSKKSKAPTLVNQKSPEISLVGYKKVTVEGEGSSYQCTHAGCKFTSKYTTHIKSHVAAAHDSARSLCCGYCSCRFDSQTRLDKHVKMYHANVDQSIIAPTSKEDEIDDQDVENEEDEDELFTGVAVLKCQISGCTFETPADEEFVLENHMKSAHSPKAKFTCYNCPCRFNDKDALDNHIKSMHISHKLNDINNEDSSSSDWRRFDLEESEATEPTSSQHSNPFQCKFCDFVAVNKSGFITHLTAAHSAKNPFKCDQCFCRFKSQGGLGSHQYKCHSKKKQPSFKAHTTMFERMQEKKTRGLQKPKIAPPAKENHNCHLCSALFNNGTSLNWHMIRAHAHRVSNSSTDGARSKAQTPNSTTEDVLSNSAIAKAARKYAEVEGPDDMHSDSENDDLFEKHIFSKKKGSSKSDISSDTTPVQTHISKPSNHKKCSKCPYTAAPSLIAQHESRAHIENGISCPFCTCSYKSETSLRQHVALSHKTPTRKSSTPVHTRVTRNSIDLRERQKISVQETDDVLSTRPSTSSASRSEKETPAAIPIAKLHKCYLCSYTCRLPVNLEAHKLTAHVKGGYVCKYCPCAYRTSAALNNHLKLRHKKYISVVLAGREKMSYQNVEEDDGSQSEDDESSSELALRCSQCSFSTNQSVKLTAHMNVEHPNSPNLAALNDSSQDSSIADEFFCSECSFTTSLRIKLKRHEEKHKNAQEPKNNTPPQASAAISDDVSGKEEVPSRRSLRSRKRKSDCPDKKEEEQSSQQQSKQVASVEPKAKQIKVQLEVMNTLKRPLSTRTSTRRSAEAAKKVIDSVIQSEQIDDDELDTVDEAENKSVKKRKKLDSAPPSIISISEENEQDTNMEDDELIENDTTASPKISKSARHAKVMKQVNDRQSLKEVATLQRPTDLVRNAKQMQESNKRTAGLREFMRFTCSRCALSFDTVRQLTFHFHRCEENFKEFTCKLCDNQVSFGTLLKLKEHIWRNHLVEEDRLKSQLDSTASKSSEQCPYVCSLCKFGLSDRKAYIFHLSVPHLFRCKKCAFVSGTKTVMDEHKQNIHKKPDLPSDKVVENEEEPSLPPPPPDSDDILIVYESTVPISKAVGRAERRRKMESKDSSSTDTGKLPGSQNEDQDKNEDQNNEKTMEDDEPEVGESLICDECGHFSMTLEDAHAHNQALANIESLICFVCGYMATSPCDSILHSQTHQPEDDDGDDDSTGMEESEKDHEEANTTMVPVPDYEIEIEFKDSPCQLEGLDIVDVPLVSDDHAKNLESDTNRVIFIQMDNADN
ncbi:zinc finger protein 423 isoform X2 [Folsomia candida]|uniref:zinc finger protein 423 isoform X2 n=1 Tax=Folsomia candida TaxID=158441 RepID=UPI000B9078AE|nr:zinc finger protein 423 isoform X2 [Folsomia candida]